MPLRAIPPMPPLPSVFIRIRRAIIVFAALVLALGLFASLEALVVELQTPANSIDVVRGNSVTLTGSVSADIALPLQIHLNVQPTTSEVLFNAVTSKKSWFSDDISWEATLTFLPDVMPGDYTVHVSISDQPSIHIPAWHLRIYENEAQLREASPSVFYKVTGFDSLQIALYALLWAVTLAALYPVINFVITEIMRTKGYLRVYHSKEEGNDTLLYCIDRASSIIVGLSYPVMTPSGQMLGIADVAQKGRKYCILRLPAGRAKAGCLIQIVAGATK